MRLLALSLTLVAVSALADCTSSEQKSSNRTTTTTNTTVSKTTTATPAQGDQTATTPANNGLPVAPAHGDSAPPVASNPAAANEQAGIDTSALDAKIVKAEEKAKAKNATQAEKLAAASAYMERADIFMNAGRPALYKYALRDYRRTLHYQPDNKQARDSMNMIVSIYQSMGRPVPELGNEP